MGIAVTGPCRGCHRWGTWNVTDASDADCFFCERCRQKAKTEPLIQLKVLTYLTHNFQQKTCCL